MRVAVYDRWWSTGGGGEKFAGGIAQALSDRFDVDLIGHEELDLAQLSERLQLDLSRVGYRRVPLSEADVEDVSGDYDLFVNASYTSTARNRARAGIYVVHFPTPPVVAAGGWRRLVAPLAERFVTGGAKVEAVSGLHPPERVGRMQVRWTSGDAELDVQVPPGCRGIVVPIARLVPPAVAPLQVRLEMDGEIVASHEVTPRSSRLEPSVLRVAVPCRPGARHVHLRVVSDTFVPHRDLGWPDERRLGVPLVGAGACVGSWLSARLQERLPFLVASPITTGWVHTYSVVCANSRYTAEWVRRWWDVEPVVLYPPVTAQPVGEKEPIVLSVGRFFDPERGHSKKQLEMVRAFRRLLEVGAEGWSLHLVGGCSPEDRVYLERVKHAIGDAPVELHVDATGEELRDLYARASIYWHAAGLGENPRRHPDRFEHFGITTVEAMSAGAVPVVIAAAGQAEVVRHGVDGFQFRDLDELVAYTDQLTRDQALRRRLAAQARLRAHEFMWPAFCERLDTLVAELLGEASGVRPDAGRGVEADA